MTSQFFMMLEQDSFSLLAVMSARQPIDQEIKRIIDECYQKSKDILMEHEKILHKCADLLLEKEKISRDEFEALFEG